MIREAFGSIVIAFFNDAPHPNAAKVFTNWLLSEKGQTVHAQESGLNSRRMDIPIVDQATYIEPGQSLLSTNKQKNEELVKRSIQIVKEELK